MLKNSEVIFLYYSIHVECTGSTGSKTATKYDAATAATPLNIPLVVVAKLLNRCIIQPLNLPPCGRLQILVGREVADFGEGSLSWTSTPW